MTLGLLVLVLGLGVGLRFHGLERQSLWDDEMSTRKDTYLPLAIWPAVFRTYEVHPPLYFLQLKAWQQVFGSSLKAQRANSAAWGSLALLLMFLLARRHLDPEAALTATALLALSPYHLAYSQEMRPYAMAVALAILGFLLIEKKNAFALIGVFSAEFYTHYWGAFMVAAQVAYGVLSTTDVRERRKVLLSGACAGVLFSAWWPILRDQLFYIKELSFWVDPASPVNVLKTFVAFTGTFFHYASMAFQAPGPAVVRWIVAGLTLLLAGWGIRKGSRAAWIWVVIGLGLPYIGSYYRHGLYVWYRYPVLVYPGFLLLVASGLAMIPKTRLRLGLIAGLLLTSSWSCYAYKTSWQKANPKTVVAYIHSLQHSEATVIRPSYFASLFAYYDEGKMHVIDQDQLSSPVKRAALPHQPIIFIAFDVPYDPVRDALLSEFKVQSAQYFPGFSHLGITVYQLGHS